MADSLEAPLDRFVLSSTGFERRLRAVRPGQWAWPTPCTDWNVRRLDYPLGKVAGRQALAVRTTDATIHTWDLARAIGVEDDLDAGLVSWIDDHLEHIYAGLAETPVAADTTHRFFAAPRGASADDTSRQDRLLRRMGRTPGHGR